MTAAAFDVFDTTLQKTQEWLDDILAELGEPDRHLAYAALRVVLHELRDRLPMQEAVDLGAQLPMLVRGFYYEGWRPSKTPTRSGRAELLAAIRDHFARRARPPEPEVVARAVLRVLAARTSPGEIADVRHVLPKDLRDLWPG